MSLKKERRSTHKNSEKIKENKIRFETDKEAQHGSEQDSEMSDTDISINSSDKSSDSEGEYKKQKEKSKHRKKHEYSAEQSKPEFSSLIRALKSHIKIIHGDYHFIFGQFVSDQLILNTKLGELVLQKTEDSSAILSELVKASKTNEKANKHLYKKTHAHLQKLTALHKNLDSAFEIMKDLPDENNELFNTYIHAIKQKKK